MVKYDCGGEGNWGETKDGLTSELVWAAAQAPQDWKGEHT